jgi:predicted TIM-barrel fold metal-dependent hydrolase
MESAISGGYVSADGHVVEPADLWSTRMDRRFRDRAPRVNSRPDADYYLIDGLPAMPVGLEGVSMEDKISGKIKSPKGRRHRETRAGAHDSQARLADQAIDHLRAEVIYPGLGLFISGAPDGEYVRECFRVYNDWLSEFCADAPDRLLGVGLLPMKGPIAWAVEEAERSAKKGLRSFGIPTELPGRSYQEREFDQLWATLQEIGLPISLHVGMDEPFHVKVTRLGMAKAYTDSKICSAERAMADLILGAVPQRYPKLRFVLAEGGIGWIASVLRSIDHWWEDHHHWMEPKVDEPPSFYFGRRFWATFEDDRAGVLTRELVGVDRLMWGSDYPHTEGTFPHSQEQIMKDFRGVSEAEVQQMVAGNAARLYGVDL